MSLVTMIPTGLRVATKALSWVTDKSEKSPKAANSLASVAMLGLGYWGIDKTDIAAVGSMIIKLGKLLGGV